ncbi:hypothetical protein F4808DRAFT_291233 [Astrocystis sublimbata]|nr:hypothetical protein F4808DRAFT_291233 [Astrocystis sublimbata]
MPSAQSTPSAEPQPLLDNLQSIPLEQLIAYVDSEMDTLKEAESTVNQRRSRGVHKRASQLQGLMFSFSQFLKAYSGIVDILQTVDSSYGNVASASLSLLFATVRMKAEAEQSMQSCMRRITDRMPDLTIYNRIYPNRELGMMLAEAYKEVIVFARKVTIYWRAHSYKRCLRHLDGKFEFQDMEQQMEETSNRIRMKCDVLLAERIDHLVKENERMYCYYHLEVQPDITFLVLQTREDERQVREVAKELGLNNYQCDDSRQQQLREIQESLTYQFQSDRRRQMMDAKRFMDTEDGKFWESIGTTLMILFGRNEVASSISESWLSLVPTEIAQDCLRKKRAIAYERCGRTSTLEKTLSSLITQFLANDPALTRQSRKFRDIHSLVSRTSHGFERADRLCRALLDVVNLHKSPVFIILDRPELCEAMEEESCAEYIRKMLSLVKETTADLKIMMTLRSEMWDFDRGKKDIDLRGVDSTKIRPVRLDQQLARLV